MRISNLVSSVLLTVAVQPTLAFDGAVDPAFGTNGQVVIVRPNINASSGIKPTGDLEVLADGRFMWAAPLDDGSVWVGRAFRDGTADVTFGDGDNGRITLPACVQQQRPVRLIGDGASGAYVWSNRCLRHLLDDGTTDPAFGLGNMPPEGFIAADLARDAMGRFILGGREGQLARVYRFDSAGVADSGFGNAGGVAVSPAVDGWVEVDALVIRPNGRILLAGAIGNSFGWSASVAQLNPDGSPDVSWSEKGFFELAEPPGFHTTNANALALDADGSLVVSGTGNNSFVGCCILVTRLDATGQVVPEFGSRLFNLPGQPGLNPSAEHRAGLTVLPNHRIIIGTVAFPFDALANRRTRYTVIRTYPNGELDPGFGNGGWNSYTINKPGSVVGLGDYNQMHAMGYDPEDESMLILGRTFFEDAGTEDDYVSMVRARFDLIFDSGFD